MVALEKNIHTYMTTKKLLDQVKSYGAVDYEIVSLFDYNIKACIGCKACLDKDEKLCPLEDDRDLLIDKMQSSDGVIFATPNYAFQVSGQMKVFLDRIAFYLHRPKFFSKTYTSLVVEGVYGGKKIIKYLDFVAQGIGFNVVKNKGIVKTLEPISEKQNTKNNQVIKTLGDKYYKTLMSHGYPKPSLMQVIIFRVTRSKIKESLDSSYKDYNYYESKGWFGSSYYYGVKLNPVKSLLGKLADYFTIKLS